MKKKKEKEKKKTSNVENDLKLEDRRRGRMINHRLRCSQFGESNSGRRR